MEHSPSDCVSLSYPSPVSMLYGSDSRGPDFGRLKKTKGMLSVYQVGKWSDLTYANSENKPT